LTGLLSDLTAGTPLGLGSLGYSLVAFVIRVGTRDWVQVNYQRMLLVWAMGAVIFEGLANGILLLGAEVGLAGALFRHIIPCVLYDVGFGMLVLAALPQAWWRRL
jgi:cell shape-determining protein MreD